MKTRKRKFMPRGTIPKIGDRVLATKDKRGTVPQDGPIGRPQVVTGPSSHLSGFETKAGIWYSRYLFTKEAMFAPNRVLVRKKKGK